MTDLLPWYALTMSNRDKPMAEAENPLEAVFLSKKGNLKINTNILNNKSVVYNRFTSAISSFTNFDEFVNCPLNLLILKIEAKNI